MKQKKENCGINIIKNTTLNTENKEPYFTWTKKWGWRVNGYIKKENEK